MDEAAECEIDRGRSGSATERGRPPAGPGPADPVSGWLRQRLVTSDGVRLEAAYLPHAPKRHHAESADSALRAAGLALDVPRAPSACVERQPALVLAHGFTGALARPAVLRAARVLSRYAAVVTFSFRGHGRSGGQSTVGALEVQDLAAAVRWARALGHGPVATVGFSMGGSVVVRHGALVRPAGVDGQQQPDAHPTAPGNPEPKDAGSARNSPGAGAASGPPAAQDGGAHRTAGMDDCPAAHADAVVAVSSPARWYYRGTASMRRLHFAIQHPVGRLVSRYGLHTRVRAAGWDPVPLAPVAAAPLVAPTPLLVVHGDRDPYFPLDHPHSLAEAADPAHTDLWIERGFGHAENAASAALLHRVGAWATAQLGGGCATGCRVPGAEET